MNFIPANIEMLKQKVGGISIQVWGGLYLPPQTPIRGTNQQPNESNGNKKEPKKQKSPPPLTWSTLGFSWLLEPEFGREASLHSMDFTVQ
nr:hypothetical protein Iba_chr03eCG6750 [Ipomoea batatas]